MLNNNLTFNFFGSNGLERKEINQTPNSDQEWNGWLQTVYCLNIPALLIHR